MCEKCKIWENKPTCHMQSLENDFYLGTHGSFYCVYTLYEEHLKFRMDKHTWIYAPTFVDSSMCDH